MAFSLTTKQAEGNRLLAACKYVLLRGGSRSGKSFLIIRAIVIRAIKADGSHHAVFRFRRNAITASIWGQTFPTVMRVCFPNVPYERNKSDLVVTLPNGSEIWFAGLDDKDRVDKILGMEFATLFFNECSQIPWGSVETALSRLAEKTVLRLRAYFDCNPTTKLHWSFNLFKKQLRPGTREAVSDPSEYAEMRINPDDNRENISEEYFSVLDNMSAAKRKRFKDGEWAEATDGALWTLENIDEARVSKAPPLKRVVVAVDPSGTAGDEDAGNDDIGIVVAGLGFDNRIYVLADWSCNLSPSMWAARVVQAYKEFKADRIVAETNYGGAMVGALIKVADRNAAFKQVHASRGKIVRAEPISAIYEEGRASHVGTHEELEDQMCAMTTKGFIGEGSPDRADALVWAVTELISTAEPIENAAPEIIDVADTPDFAMAGDSDDPWGADD